MRRLSVFSAYDLLTLFAGYHSTLRCCRPRKGPPRFLTKGRMSMTKSGSACVYCVQLFRFIELYRVAYLSVSFGFVC